MSSHDKAAFVGRCVIAFAVAAMVVAMAMASFGPVVIFGGVP